MYRINFGVWSGVFAVPNEVVDHHIKLCGPVALQVLLVLLRRGYPMESDELAQKLGQNRNDIEDALAYWQAAGIIITDALQGAAAPKTVAPAAVVEQIAPPATQTTKTPPAPVAEETEETEEARKVRLERFARMTRQDVLEVSERDNVVGHLLEETQEVLGRILSNRETESIVGLYYNYAMPPDIILMLLHYCKTIEKDSIAYIERLGVDWINREINTHEGAEQELLRLTEHGEKENIVRSIFGIRNRGITRREVEYYTDWSENLKMPQPLIELACERTNDNHGKQNFAYTNAILQDWHRKGITSVKQASREEKPQSNTKNTARRGKGATGNDGPASYDLDKVEEMLDYGSVWD